MRYFFVGLGLLYAGVALAGFTPSYRAYFRGARDIHWFAHLHGGLMSAWLLLYITQTGLAASGSIRVHRSLGAAGIGLGVLIWLSMWTASLRVRLALNPPADSFLWDVFATETAISSLFALFLVWGIARRHEASTHKRLMTLATVVLLQAAIDRLPWLRTLVRSSPELRLLYPACLHALIAPLVVFDIVTARRIHRVTMIGFAIVLAAQLIVAQLTGRPGWREFAHGVVNALR